MEQLKQSVLNIGTLGHIDHGKTSLTRAITHMWTDRHSESIKRNMTIKLGYADTIIKKCPKCEGVQAYTTEEKCSMCGSKTEPLMRISLLDAPGHETLMATAISGASVIDGILFVIAANEPCPMQQTREHLMIINLLGIKNVIIVQSKVDIVGKEGAIKHYKQIRDFVKGTVIENAPIVPVMTNQGINVDIVLEKIVNMPRPARDTTSEPMMYVVRSFDVNRPGLDAENITGGVIGGAIIRGKFKVGDEIEVRPGMKEQKGKKEAYSPIITKIVKMSNGEDEIKEATPGGLIGLSTEIDPTFTKADSLVGNVVGHIGKLPQTSEHFMFKYHKLNRPDIPEQSMKENETLVMGVGTATAIGFIKKAKNDNVEVELKRPAVVEKGAKIAVMRNIGQRWRLTGYGIVS
ncbi:MAG: translation initiation factor IF-2 subunit gamma [Candidatus Marsarchaeota archaeon]|nr:translation initiation factor IF-2 subunit gamma [Candidatus Marsarchaeota archaeon]